MEKKKNVTIPEELFIDLVKYFKNFDWSILLFIMAIINVVVYLIDTKLYAGK